MFNLLLGSFPIRFTYQYHLINRILNRKLATFQIENPCEKSSCAGLCLLRSAAHTNRLNYTCMCEDFIPITNNPWCGDHPTRSDSQFKSSTKFHIQIDSSTKPPSTSALKNDVLESTKDSLNFAPACERDFTIGIFNIMSGGAFAFSIFTLWLLIRNNLRPNINIAEQMEL